MQHTKTLTFITIIVVLVSLAAALLFYLGLLPQLQLAVPFVLAFVLAALIAAPAWVQLHRFEPGYCLWGKAASLSAYAAFVIALIVLATVPVPGTLWSTVLIFAFLSSFLLSSSLVLYLLIVFWDVPADR